MVSKITSVKVPLALGHLQAIGRVCALWSVAENVFQHLLWSMIPTTIEHGKALTTHMSNESIVNALRTLAQQRTAPKKFMDDMGLILDELNDLRLQRNQVVHNVWAGDDRDLSIGYKPSAKGTYKLNASYWSATDIEELANDIEAWIISCINFCEDSLGWPQGFAIPIPERRPS